IEQASVADHFNILNAHILHSVCQFETYVDLWFVVRIKSAYRKIFVDLNCTAECKIITRVEYEHISVCSCSNYRTQIVFGINAERIANIDECGELDCSPLFTSIE